MTRVSLRTVFKQRARARWKALTSRRGYPQDDGPGRGWHWAYFWEFRRRRSQKKPAPTWRPR